MEAFNAIMDEAKIKPQIMQIECHPFAQRHETRELAEKYGMQVECWYPIGHADPELLQNEVLKEIADAHNKSVVQVILRWHMQEGLCAVPGSTNSSHIQENIDIFDFELTDDEMAQIRGLDKGEAGRYFNIDYQQMGGFLQYLFGKKRKTEHETHILQRLNHIIGIRIFPDKSQRQMQIFFGCIVAVDTVAVYLVLNYTVAHPPVP